MLGGKLSQVPFFSMIGFKESDEIAPKRQADVIAIIGIFLFSSSAMIGASNVIPLQKKLQNPYDVASIDEGNSSV